MARTAGRRSGAASTPVGEWCVAGTAAGGGGAYDGTVGAAVQRRHHQGVAWVLASVVQVRMNHLCTQG
jgi:hypothetical protein